MSTRAEPPLTLKVRGGSVVPSRGSGGRGEGEVRETDSRACNPPASNPTGSLGGVTP